MRIKQYYIVLGLAAFALLVYYPAIHAPLCLVDDYDVLNYFTGRKFSLINTFFPKDVGYYRPLIHLVFYLEDYLWMLEESFLHLDTVLFHVVNVIIVYFIGITIGRLLMGEKCTGIAFFAAILFAVHPLNTESVDWIAGRSDPLSGIFLFLSIYLLLKSLEHNSTKLFTISSLSLFTACLAKETAIFAYPGMLFVMYCHDIHTGLIPSFKEGTGGSWWSVAAGLKSRLRQLCTSLSTRKYYYLIISMVPVLYFVLRKCASSVSDRSMNKIVRVVTTQENLSSVIFKSFKAMGFYLKKLFIPWPLNFNIVNISDGYVLLGVLLIVLLIWFLWRQSVIAAFFVYAIGIGSSSIFVLLGTVAWTPFAERYMYLASAPFTIGMVFLVYELIKRCHIENKAPYFALLVIGILSISTVQRNLVWMDDIKLYEDSVQKAPDFFRAWRNYAVALDRAERKDDAIKIHSILGKIKNRKDGSEVRRAFSEYKGL